MRRRQRSQRNWWVRWRKRRARWLDAARHKKGGGAGFDVVRHEEYRRQPGFRVLDGRFATDPVAMAIPKGRDLGMAYARKFVEDAKSEGLVKAAIERAGIRGAVVPP